MDEFHANPANDITDLTREIIIDILSYRPALLNMGELLWLKSFAEKPASGDADLEQRLFETAWAFRETVRARVNKHVIMSRPR